MIGNLLMSSLDQIDSALRYMWANDFGSNNFRNKDPPPVRRSLYPNGELLAATIWLRDRETDN